MDIMSPTQSLTDLVASAQDSLTPSEHKLAGLVVEDPTLVAFGTVADVARKAHVSRPTVVRFARSLGFDGYSAMQERVQADLAHALARPSERIRTERGELAHADLTAALGRVVAELTGDRLRNLVKRIVIARRILVLSGETSRAGAHALTSGLNMLGRPATLVEDHATGRTIGNASPEDVAVVFDFYRYRSVVYRAAQHLKEEGVGIVVVTDGPLSPLAPLADEWFDVTVPAIGPFDSSVPAVAVAEIMVGEVARQMGASAVDGIDRTEAAWHAAGTFLD